MIIPDWPNKVPQVPSHHIDATIQDEMISPKCPRVSENNDCIAVFM